MHVGHGRGGAGARRQQLARHVGRQQLLLAELDLVVDLSDAGVHDDHTRDLRHQGSKQVIPLSFPVFLRKEMF